MTMRIKGYDEIIECLDDAKNIAGNLSDAFVKILAERDALRARVASLEAALRDLLDNGELICDPEESTHDWVLAADRARLALAPRSERREGEHATDKGGCACPNTGPGYDPKCPACGVDGGNEPEAPPAAPKEEAP